MKIKLDENMPASLVNKISEFGHDVDTVPQELLSGKLDNIIWSETQKYQRFLITQDLDFSNINKFIPGSHFGILLIRLKEPGRKALTERVKSIFASEDVENLKGCFVVATEHKIRIRRPK
jgi:predicted nuclease of predicted toxin-antitoxin system